jgi:hypothetical protein
MQFSVTHRKDFSANSTHRVFKCTGAYAMGLKYQDLSSSLVLDFAVFIAGFLTGILAFGVIHVSSDITTISVIVFVLGFVIGIIAAGFTIVLLKRRKHPPLND